MSEAGWWERQLRKNPVLAREILRGVRTGRPLVLLLPIAPLVGVIVLSVVALRAVSGEPAAAGAIAFQVFFSLAYFAVTLVSPSLAAYDLAGERDTRTWDALVLAPLGLASIGRGKFWANALAMAALLSMIAPLAFICPLLQGATVAEVVVALFLLGPIAAVSLGFGCAVGAFARGASSAVLVALVSSLIAAPLFYLSAGLGLSALAHGTWPRVSRGMPVWLPLAYVRAPLNGTYLLLLIAVPVALSALALWFFYELTLAGMRDESDDRTTGLKKWYLAALPAIAGIAAIPGAMTHGSARLDAWLAGLGGLFLFLLLAAFVLAGDAWEASPRLELRWQQGKVHWVTRIMGPGLVQTLMIVLVSGLLCTAMFSLVGAAALSYPAEPGLPPAPAVALLLCGETWGAFFVFMVGFLLWARSRSRSASGARIVLLFVSAIAVAAPWLTSLAVHYGGERGVLDSFLLSSPSPLYALVVVSAILRGEPHLPMVSSIACSLGWVLLGVLLFGLGARRATRIVALRRRERASLEAMVFSESKRAPVHPNLADNLGAP